MNAAAAENEQKATAKASAAVTPQMKAVLDYLAEYGEMSDAELQELLNVKKTRAYLLARQMQGKRPDHQHRQGKRKEIPTQIIEDAAAARQKPCNPNPFLKGVGSDCLFFDRAAFMAKPSCVKKFSTSPQLSSHRGRFGDTLPQGGIWQRDGASNAALLSPYIVLVPAGGLVRYAHDDQVVFQRGSR